MEECEFCGAPIRTFEDRNGDPFDCCVDDCQGELEAEDEATDE